MSSPEGAKPFSSGTKYGEVPLDDSDHETSEPITRLRRLSSALLEEQYHDSMPSALNKSPKIGVFEIDADGKTNYKETGLRNLSNYVNLLINLIDNAPPKDLGKKKSSLRINQDDLAIRSRASSSTPLPKVTRRQSLGRIDDSLQMALSAGSAKEATAPKQIAERLSEKIAPPIPVPIHSLSSTMKNQLNQLQAANNVGTMIKLSHRDIRRLDWHYNPSQDPLLLVRRHCILLSQHPFRVLIMAHRIFVLPPANPHDCALFHKLFAPIHQALLDWSLSAHTRRRSQTSIDRKPHPSPSRPRVSTMHLSPPEPFPFEFHCLEIIFTTALSINGHYVKLYAKQLKSALESYQAISSSRSHYLVTNEIDTMKSISNHITSLHILLQRMKTTLDTLADDEEELALMNLSYLESKPSLYKYVFASLLA